MPRYFSGISNAISTLVSGIVDERRLDTGYRLGLAEEQVGNPWLRQRRPPREVQSL